MIAQVDNRIATALRGVDSHAERDPPFGLALLAAAARDCEGVRLTEDGLGVSSFFFLHSAVIHPWFGPESYYLPLLTRPVLLRVCLSSVDVCCTFFEIACAWDQRVRRMYFSRRHGQSADCNWTSSNFRVFSTLNSVLYVFSAFASVGVANKVKVASIRRSVSIIHISRSSILFSLFCALASQTSGGGNSTNIFRMSTFLKGTHMFDNFS